MKASKYFSALKTLVISSLSANPGVSCCWWVLGFLFFLAVAEGGAIYVLYGLCMNNHGTGG